MALNDIKVPKENAQGTFDEVVLSRNDIGAAPATGISPSAITGTAIVDSDARLSDSRTPTAHAASHASAGSDPLAPSDIGAQSLFTTTNYNITGSGSFTLTAARAQIAIIENYSGAKTVTLPTSGNQSGDIAVVRANPSIGTLTVAGAVGGSQTIPTTGSRRYVYDGTNWQRDPVYTHEHEASDITSGTLAYARGGLAADAAAYNGLVKISGGSTSAVTVTSAGEALLDDADAAAQRTTLGLGTAATAATGDFAAASHTHTASAITDSTTAGRALLTASDAAAQRTSLGLAAIATSGSANDLGSGTVPIARIPTGSTSITVALGDHTHSQLHDRSHAITSTSDHTASNWSVFYSNGSGQVTELALGAANTVLTSNGASSAPSFAAAASGGTKTYAVFTAEHNQPPSSSFATLDTRNSIAVLDFDDATTESAVFVGIMPEAASLGSGLIVRIHFMATTATSGNVRWSVSFERGNTDLDADSFDTATAATTATSSTSGIPAVSAITCTSIDGITAGDPFRLRVQRLGADAADSMSGDAEILAVEVRSAA